LAKRKKEDIFEVPAGAEGRKMGKEADVLHARAEVMEAQAKLIEAQTKSRKLNFSISEHARRGKEHVKRAAKAVHAVVKKHVRTARERVKRHIARRKSKRLARMGVPKKFRHMTLRERWEDMTEGTKGLIIYIILGYLLAIGINYALGVALHTDTPVVAVFSESMVPTMLKGDLVFVAGTQQVNAGDIIVFDAVDSFGNRVFAYPIIHRAIAVENGTITTKGDNNASPDAWETTIGRVHGKAVARVPLLGWVKVGLFQILNLA